MFGSDHRTVSSPVTTNKLKTVVTKVILNDKRYKEQACSSLFGKGKANSNRAVAITAKKDTIRENNDKYVMSSGAYNLEMTGDNKQEISCARTVPETKISTEETKSVFNRLNIRLFVHT